MYIAVFVAFLSLYLESHFCTAEFYFDTDELTSNVYDLSISNIPVLINGNIQLQKQQQQQAASLFPSSSVDILTGHGDSSHGALDSKQTRHKKFDHLTLGNKKGRPYYCLIPHKATDAEIEEEMKHRRDLLNNVSVSEVETILNQHLYKCFRRTIGWWTYEFCNNVNHVTQFHVDNIDQPADPDHQILLGSFDPLLQWNSSAQNTSYVQKKQPLYYTRQYVGGSVCDVSLKPRKTEIRFYCDESALRPELRSVEEDETCAYIMHVYTKGLCLIEAFVPPNAEAVSNEIECHPTVDQEEMDLYNKNQKESHAKKTVTGKPDLHFNVDPVENVGKSIEKRWKKYEDFKNEALNSDRVANGFQDTIQNLLRRMRDNLNSRQAVSKAPTFVNYVDELIRKEKRRKKTTELDEVEEPKSLKDLGVSLSKMIERLEKEIEKDDLVEAKSSSAAESKATETVEQSKKKRKKAETFVLDTKFTVDGDVDEDSLKKQTGQLEKQIASKFEQKYPKLDGKVKIEIATAYYDSRSKKYRVIKSGALDTFGSLMYNLIGGRTESYAEEERHSAMEQNYEFDPDEE